MGKLIVSLSPHAHGTDTVERNMYGVIIALMPALLVSFYFFGLGSAIVCATSVAACVLLEWAINKFMLKNPRNTVLDGSAVLTGLLLGFNLPSNLPIWIIIIGAIFAIGFAKMPFGGLGNNLFNPALVGRAALLVAFPAQMTTWPKVGQLGSYLDAETGATPLSLMKVLMPTECMKSSESFAAIGSARCSTSPEQLATERRLKKIKADRRKQKTLAFFFLKHCPLSSSLEATYLPLSSSVSMLYSILYFTNQRSLNVMPRLMSK